MKIHQKSVSNTENNKYHKIQALEKSWSDTFGCFLSYKVQILKPSLGHIFNTVET